MSKIEETLVCGVDRLPLINRGCHLFKANEHIGKECCEELSFYMVACFQDTSLLLSWMVIVDYRGGGNGNEGEI